MDTTGTIGRLFGGRYEVEAFLGGGGMAAVWRGRDLRLDRPVAIKELAGAWLRDPVAAERFDREARTAARLAHPNIVAVHDVGNDDNGQYLVMELIEGTTVAAMLADSPLPVDQAIAIAAQTCDGLAAAHAAGIIHRDIKPGNLMITPTGVVKICDFGIAKALLEAPDTNQTGPTSALGTSRYVAPEQALGGPVDARADLYALGCTIYAMLTGAAPFSGDGPEVVHRHLTESPVPLREHRADVPRPLGDLVAQLLAKDPVDRPANAAEVRARLMSLPLEATTTSIPFRAQVPVTGPRPAARTVPPRARTLTTARAALLVLAALLLLAIPAYLISTSPSVSGGSAASPAPAPSAAAERPVTAPSATAPVTSTPRSQPPPAVRSSRSAPAAVPVQPSSEAPPVDPVVALRLAIQEQVSTGNLNPDKAADLYKKVDEVAREMNEGDTEDAIKKVGELRDKLATLLKDGQLSAAGYDTLIERVDVLAAALS